MNYIRLGSYLTYNGVFPFINSYGKFVYYNSREPPSMLVFFVANFKMDNNY